MAKQPSTATLTGGDQTHGRHTPQESECRASRLGGSSEAKPIHLWFILALRKRGQTGVRLFNPKRVPKPYKKADYPGQKVQIDVKYIPRFCLVGTEVEDSVEDSKENGGYYYQYTFIDDYSRIRYLEAFEEHNTNSSSEFIQCCVRRFPFVEPGEQIAIPKNG